MYRLAVCEDEPTLRAELCTQCREILTELMVEHEIVSFSSAEELESALVGGARFHLFCLDILLAQKSGLELALEIREHDKQTSILFITSSMEYALEGYKAEAARYLLKPVKRELLEEALQTCLSQNRRSESITLRGSGKTVVLPVEEIRYAESRNHNCVFHMVHGERSYPITLTQLEELLPKAQFCRCHNSYLVNLAQIEAHSKREILLTGGIRLSIGRHYAQQFQRDFIRYLTG